MGDTLRGSSALMTTVVSRIAFRLIFYDRWPFRPPSMRVALQPLGGRSVILKSIELGTRADIRNEPHE